jgi:hypothetical protein
VYLHRKCYWIFDFEDIDLYVVKLHVDLAERGRDLDDAVEKTLTRTGLVQMFVD